MSGTVPDASPIICSVDATGIHAPSYATVLAWLQAQYQSLYGSDVYLGADSQDGQLLAIFAAALNDSNALAVAVYNSFSPATAQGNGLSSVVKINGLSRRVATYSTVLITVTGTVGTSLANASVLDSANQIWLLPAITIPNAGFVNVTATSAAPGAITTDGIGSNLRIATPVSGWTAAAVAGSVSIGQAQESDASLRQRQAQSTLLPAQTMLGGLLGGLEALANVGRVRLYENATGVVDGNGLPPFAICAVVEGAATQDVINTIGARKSPGVATFGTTTGTYTDPTTGIAYLLRYDVPVSVPITVTINIRALAGYTSAIGAEIVAAVIAAISGTGIGQNVLYTRLYPPACLVGPYAVPATPSDPTTFELTNVLITRTFGPTSADVVIAFNEVASCNATFVTLGIS